MSQKFSAVKVPLKGWVAQVWVDRLGLWVDLSGSPVFDRPEDAIYWALESWA